MKLEKTTQLLETVGNLTSDEFRINITGQTFNLFINRLYKYPLRTILQEIFSNAWDAHREAETTHIPVEITFPTALEPNLIIKDFGTGLAPETINDIYCVLCYSTKTNSNDFFGGYGLGCKSPLAYCSQYNVRSRWNHKQYDYVIYKNENDIPSITLLNITDTDEHNGLTISIPIDKYNANALQKHADRILPWAKNYTSNYVIKPLDIVLDTTSGVVYKKTDRYDSPLIALVEGIPYEIDRYALNKTLFTIPHYASYHIALKFNIGELDITPNKEELQNNPKNNTTISKKFNDLYYELVAHVIDIANTCKSYNQLCIKAFKYHKLFKEFGATLKVPNKFNVNTTIQGFIEFQIFNAYHIHEQRRGISVSKNESTTLKLDIDGKHNIIWFPTATKRIPERAKVWASNNNLDRNQRYIAVQLDSLKHAKELFNELDITIFDGSNIELKKKVRTKTLLKNIEKKEICNPIYYITPESDLYNLRNIFYHSYPSRFADTILITPSKERLIKKYNLTKLEDTLKEITENNVQTNEDDLRTYILKHEISTYNFRILLELTPKNHRLYAVLNKYAHLTNSLSTLNAQADYFNIKLPSTKNEEKHLLEINKLYGFFFRLCHSDYSHESFPTIYKTYLENTP